MLFNTPQYILFLPIVVLVYYFIPNKLRHVWLLAVSYYFYMQWNPLYITLLFFCTLLTYVCGRMIDSFRHADVNENSYGGGAEECVAKRKQKLCLAVCIILNLGILGFFKYFSFAIQWLNHGLSFLHLGTISWDKDILLPVGISFYTLQALGYVIDVYRGDIYAEKNFIRYALFVSFFPQLVAGPIERSKNLLVQLNKTVSFSYENLRRGALLVLYGLFLKMVISDRAAMIVDTVYGNSEVYPGFYIVVATCFFSIQIYCDFYGYSTIARGSALLMGIRLMDNFSAPYLARSVKEFWRRWHISLSGWFRDYLYIPLGGNRKGKLRKDCNLLIVFGISGLWHGASLAFIFWGLLNGVYQILEDIFVEIKRFVMNQFYKIFPDMKKKSEDACFSSELFHILCTFTLVTFAWLFFRAGGLREAVGLLRDMFSCNNWLVLVDGSLYELGVAKNYMNVLLLSIAVLFVVDCYRYRGEDVAGLLLKQGWWFRVSVIMLLIFTILLYGCYGELYDIQQFIYFQF